MPVLRDFTSADRFKVHPTGRVVKQSRFPGGNAMHSLDNVEKSSFHKGEYVGHAAGKVWRITRRCRGWKAVPRNSLLLPVYGATLAEISASLTRLDEVAA